MNRPKVRKLRQPVVVELENDWCVRISGVGDCLLQAVRDLANERSTVELGSAWVTATFFAPDGQRQRLTLNLMQHDLSECGDACGFKRALLATMETLLVRHRQRGQPREKAAPAPASDWPFPAAHPSLN